MMNRKTLGSINVLLLVTLVYFAFPQVHESVFPTHQIHDATLDKTEFRAGDVLSYTLTVSRRAVCNPKVFRFVYRVHDGNVRELMQTAQFVGAVGGVGHRMRVRGKFTLDPNLPPGEYETGGFVINNCREEGGPTVSIPRSKFTIVES